MIECWITANKVELGAIKDNELLKKWWANLEKYLPAFQRAKAHEEDDLKTWLEGGKLNRKTLKHLLRTVMVWVSWIHEDVGHSSAAYVYNGEHTPMCIPED